MTRSGRETDLGQRRREQVLPGDAPQHLALGPRRDAGGEQRGRSAIDGGVAAARDLVQRPKRQPAARKPAVDGLDPERQYRSGAQRRSLKALNLLAKATDCRWLDGDTHGLLNALTTVCSCYVHSQAGKSQSADLAPASDLAAKVGEVIVTAKESRNRLFWRQDGFATACCIDPARAIGTQAR